MVRGVAAAMILLSGAIASDVKIIFRKSLNTEIAYTYAAGFPINITLDIFNLGTE